MWWINVFSYVNYEGLERLIATAEIKKEGVKTKKKIIESKSRTSIKDHVGGINAIKIRRELMGLREKMMVDNEKEEIVEEPIKQIIEEVKEENKKVRNK